MSGLTAVSGDNALTDRAGTASVEGSATKGRDVPRTASDREIRR